MPAPIHIDTNRIIVTRDVRAPDGTLRVQAGARGTVRSTWGDRYGVLFDSGQDVFIEAEPSGRLFRDVPSVDTQFLDVHLWVQRQASLQ